MSPEVAAALWTGGITVFGSALTLILTNNHNKKTLKEQHRHQKELAIIQHSMDKRTAMVLEFSKTLEETVGILNYFYTEKADFERVELLKPEYHTHTIPQSSDHIIQERITTENMNNMLNYALQQIGPVEDKLINLDTSFNLLSIYLEEDEKKIFSFAILEIRTLSHLIINGLRHRKEEKDPMSDYLLWFVHIDEPLVIRLKMLNSQIDRVRSITKKYVYVHKLEK